MKSHNWFIILRVLLGCVFIVSGFEKLIGPFENFQYVVENYEVLGSVGNEIVARTFPWIELIVGVFLVIGLWLRPSLIITMLMFVTFIGVVGQAIIRKLPIEECGCFGESISLPLSFIIVMDAVLLAITLLLFWKMHLTEKFSLDGFYQK